VVLVGLVVFLAWFAWLRPVALGGGVSYVVVQGSSMSPTYEDGDLVLVREESRYSVGDVIAFRAGGRFDDPTRIIHRIAGDAGDGAFQTQGDNRDDLDPWEPEHDDVIGRAFLHLPMAGDLAGFFSQPATFAALGGAAVVVGGERRRRRRRRGANGPGRPGHLMRRERVSPESRTGHTVAPGVVSRASRFTQPRWAFVGLVCTSLLAVPVLALAWSALRAPDSTQRVETVGRVEAAIGLDYRFVGSPSAVYPSGEVTASRNAAGAVVPDGPLYSRLLDTLAIQVGFRTDAEGADRLASTYEIDVLVESPGGWSATLDRVDPAAFDETEVSSLEVDLRAVAAQVMAVQQLTGVGGEEYTIRVVPRLDLSGTSEVGDVQQQLSAPMVFTVKGNLITADVVEVSEERDLTRVVRERATYSVGPVELGTQAARGLMGGLALVLVAGIAWFASVLFGGLGLGEPARIAARYRSQIVDVAIATAPPGPVVMVSAIDELARIAKVEQTVIVHEDLGDGAHRYRVFLGTVTYEYETAPEHAGHAGDAVMDAGETGG